MDLSCHSVIDQLKEPVDIVIALAGNPNVGKSVIFNQLTGMGVVTANYPGTTMELSAASTTLDGLKIGVLDLPGTYGLSAVSEDQLVARRCVLGEKPNALIYILDATNLERNLYMLIQLLELATPMVVALNLMDEAERLGHVIDPEALSRMLGVPVVPTTAIRGQGIDRLLKTAVDVAQNKGKLKPVKVRYGRDIESSIEELSRVIMKELAETPSGIPVRALAISLLEKDREFEDAVRSMSGGTTVLSEAERLAADISEHHGEPAPIRLSRERHGLAGVIVEAVKGQVSAKQPLVQRLWTYTVNPKTGIPLMIVVLGLIFAFLFYVGGILSESLTQLWEAGPSIVIQGIVHGVFGKGVLGRTLLWGFDGGIVAALSVGVPYVLTFYLILAFLEDSGYLNSMAFLSDTLMHKVGLHGRAVIPMVAGAGCNVPAIIGTRVLTSTRERFIASTLIVLVPCSARVAVIMGGVAKFAGVVYALGIFAISAMVTVGVGWGLNRMMPGQSSGLVMEMFGLRRPSLLAIGKKTWYRFKDFLFVAFPIVMIGSLFLGALYETGWIWPLSAPLKPLIIGWLGLPLITGVALIFAVLRKELALQFLVTFAIAQYGAKAANLLVFMTKEQLFVYGLVMTIYIPCIATVAVLGRELGWKRASGIIALTVGIALVLGGMANWAFKIF